LRSGKRRIFKKGMHTSRDGVTQKEGCFGSGQSFEFL
jgi:hypothetical protein